MFTPRRSSPRLGDFSYEGPYAYMITVTTSGRAPSFRDADVVHVCRKALLRVAEQLGFDVLAYCFMPDHLHILLQGSEDSMLVPFMQRFKQATSHRYKAQYGRPLWQRSYYDHVLRKDEDKEEIAGYIWNNPVRAGLVASIDEYPFSGPSERIIGQT